jgi:hypothetical protein
MDEKIIINNKELHSQILLLVKLLSCSHTGDYQMLFAA